MHSLNIKKIVGIFTLGAAVVLSTGALANAQGNGNWGHDQGKQSIKQQQKIAKQQAKAEQDRLRAEQARVRAEQARVRAEQLKQDRYNRTHKVAYSSGNNVYSANGRYRVMRNGAYYNTDGRGAELLRQAVNQGYQQGFTAGQGDRSGRRRNSYSTSSVYQSGNYGYQSSVDGSQYQYYFQQGFQKGYDDGYNSRYRYGTNSGGSVNILTTVLGSILKIQNY